ncbi:DUF721 domain-containing protein [Roseibacillus persicicus]|uniref:DUF721 domain-containing protein n=1 Tax=Roseibacillus persicicus TaxID=454148 RepID=A0A918WNL6_9BACT|nr:DUF721 domain-containing protein [Roseibacillus persicicus]GHC65971.1 hypothetical protein GCM10007100_37200 [Roseibacillus persicicus]
MKKSFGKRKAHFTKRVVRDWQGGDTPMPTEENCSKAGDWVESILGSLKISDGLEEGRIRQSWKKVAGDFVAAQTEVISLKRGVLVLRVLQPAMRFHLDQSRGDLLRKVQAELGKKAVREVRLISG